jgi:protein-L-isoaspartate(D-aspartate) O-methyltransferase
MLRQLSERGIRSGRVLSAMARVRREHFVPLHVEHLAYADRALGIGCSQTISQPYIVALMTDALELSGVESVLEIGTGSGYQTAILAELAASVVSIERHEELSLRAKQALTEHGYKNVTLIVGDGTAGWPEEAPFDRIVVTAAGPEVPPALLAQLGPLGRMILPVGRDASVQVLRLLDRREGGEVSEVDVLEVRFVPLTHHVPGACRDPGVG